MKENDYKKRWADLSIGLTHVIGTLMETKGMKKQDLAKEMGYPQSGISEVFGGLQERRDGRRKRYWSGPMLLAAADALHISVAYMFQLAEAYVATGAEILIQVQLLGTDPHSKSRANRIISLATPQGTPLEDMAKLYNVEMMGLIMPDMLRSYLDGSTTDEQLWDQLAKAWREKKPNEGFWAAVRRVC